jgi:hypothetical protein
MVVDSNSLEVREQIEYSIDGIQRVVFFDERDASGAFFYETTVSNSAALCASLFSFVVHLAWPGANVQD